jgi:hypothetical protein
MMVGEEPIEVRVKYNKRVRYMTISILWYKLIQISAALSKKS